MTDIAFLLILFLSVFYAMDPFQLYIDKSTIFKHLHMMLALPAFTLAWVGMRIRKKTRLNVSVTRVCWPLMLFSIWVMSGSMYARIHLDIIESFLILGIYITVTFGAARFIADHAAPTTLLNGYLTFILLAIFTGCFWQIAVLNEWSKFHEMEAFTVPLGVYFYIRAQTNKGRLLAFSLMIGLMLLVIKNTSFIAMSLTLVYIWWCFIRPNLAKKFAYKTIPLLLPCLLLYFYNRNILRHQIPLCKRIT